MKIPSSQLLRSFSQPTSTVAKPALDTGVLSALRQKIGLRLGLSDHENLKLQNVLKFLHARRWNPEGNLDALSKLGVSIEQQKKVALSSASIFSLKPETLMSKWGWFQDNLGVSNQEMIKLVSKHPTVFTRSLEGKVQPVLKEIEALGFSESEMRYLVLSAPQILSLSLDNSLRPRIRCYVDLGFGDEELRKFILEKPWCLEKQTVPKIEWLRKELNLKTPQLRDIILKHPKLLNNNLEEMSKSFLYLLEKDLSRWQAMDLVCMQPARSVQASGRLIDKVIFAEKALRKNIEAIVEWPEYLTRPLQGHIALRVGFLSKEGFRCWEERLCTLFTFGDEGFLRIYTEKCQSLSRKKYFEHKTWWLSLTGDQRNTHIELLMKPLGAPWKA